MVLVEIMKKLELRLLLRWPHLEITQGHQSMKLTKEGGDCQVRRGQREGLPQPFTQLCLSVALRDTQFTRRYVVVEIAWASQIDLNLNHKVATFALSDLEPA